jgi:hypothetical protein
MMFRLHFKSGFFQTTKICSNVEKMAHEEPDNFSYPVVIHGRLVSTWEPLAWSLDQWAAVLSAARPVIGVRVGQSSPSYRHPQWERFTHTESLAAERLFQPDYWDELSKGGRWAYFDYKYMQVGTVLKVIVLSQSQGPGSALISDPDLIQNLYLVPRLIPALKFYLEWLNKKKLVLFA